MSSPPQTPVSSSQFKSILDAALAEYKKKTGNDLLDNSLAKELQSCESAEAVLAIIQYQAKAFDRFRRADRGLMKWIGPSVHVLYTLSATLGEGVGMALPSAKAVFAGIGVLLATAKDVWASHDALVDLFERIQFFLKRLGVHTQISPTEDMVEILVKIVAEVLSILSIATKEMQQSRTKAYFRKLVGRTDIEDALKKLDSLTQEEVRMAIAQVLKAINELKDGAKKTNETVQQIANNVDEIKDDVEKIIWNQIEQDVRRWFSSPDPSVNYNFAREAYQEGTAAWFFQGSMFKEWELIGSLLWIHGKPGSGKSILCSAIIKHVISLRDAGQASLAYFFFDFRDKEKQNVRNFVTSLLTQLSASSEPCCNRIFHLYSAHGKGAQQPSIGVLIECLKEMLKVVAQQPVYIIIDALDECPNISGLPTPRAVLLDLLEDLLGLCIPNLHICVTSRPEIDIKIVLEPLVYSAVSLHEESGQKKDISDYVNTVVNSDRKMRKWRDADKKLVVEVLTEKADGMFRWVFCQLEVLQHCLASSIRQTLDQLPETLDETYARVLSQIPQANQAHAHRMLQCLMVAVRPLRVEELAEVLAFEFDIAKGAVPRYRAGWRSNDREQAVLSTCSSLIAIVDDHGSQVVQFSHFSVKEFLTSDRLASSLGDFSRYQINPGPAHTIIAQACLGFLLHLGDHADEKSVESFPLTGYAAQHWVTHAQFEDVAPRVKDGMESLFDPDKPHFAAWVRTYNIDGFDQTYRESNIPTPLYYSSLCGFSDLAEHLAIKHPQHLNAIGGRYGIPLRAAIVRKHIRIVEILLRHGANVDIRGMAEQTLLHEAIRDVSIVRLLLNYGADVNCRQDNHRTPLHLVVCCEELEVARVLFEYKADVDPLDFDGEAPLHLLFKHKYRENDDVLNLARLLVEHGADVNRRDKNHNTPLYLALSGRLYKCARVLLENGADARTENNNGTTPLHLLVSQGDIVRLLLERGADVNRRDKNKNTPLHLALGRRMYKCARILLENGADASVENSMGTTALHLVSQGKYNYEERDVSFARLLLERGVDVNAREKDFTTPLHSAAFRGWLGIARVLLGHGADTTAKNDQDETPLHLLSRGELHFQEQAIGVARLLLEYGVDVHSQDQNHETALHSVAFRGRPELARVLLDHGANPNAENDQGETPLHLVSRSEYNSQESGVNIARLILAHGGDANARTKDKWAPLHFAGFGGRFQIAQALLDHGANAAAENDQGETPLHLVSRGEYYSQEHGLGIARLLLEHGVDVHTQDKEHDTALHSAAFRGRLEIARLLLDRGANVNTENDQGETPLHLVSRGEYISTEHGVSIARLLLERGVDVNAPDKDHDTPLHSASYSGRLEIAHVLLDHGANVGAKNAKGETPLHLVTRGKHDSQTHGVSIAQLLLERGADMNAQDKNHATPLHLARHRGRLDIAKALLDYDGKAQAEN